MSQLEKDKQAMYSRLYSIESDINSGLSAISEARNNITLVEGSAGSLPNRLAKARQQGYAAMGHIEKDINNLNKRWIEIAPSLKQTFATSVEPLTDQGNSLQAEARGLRTQIDSGNIPYSQSLASRLSATASSFRATATSQASRVDTPLRELFPNIDSIEGDLKIAEQTVQLLSQASFPLKEGETPVLAIDAKILTGEKSEGTMFLTNQRFIFEAKKEIVLEKKLFIVTKKKIERVVLVDQPIGALQEISKGRVGLIAWTGLYVRFKPDAREEDATFDVEGWEADAVKKFYDYVIDGDADKDIAAIKGTPETTKPSIQLVTCSNCHAPYTREVFKGQKSVRCDYCGTQIVLE